ncbi:alpha-amylase family protein [Aureicoccus marinus]|uniref:hypothetical protein n=1 Tax=Aureicoccus marinus TaxID=754435 RepID=UPI001C61640F|nr:hypothetical protein [Aureicoccus marinus]
MHAKNKEQSRKSTGAAASNLDLYQVNCTYYEALGQNDTEYLLARAIQFFLPGVPQVYYVGLFGDVNDMELLSKTGVGRDINRHYYSKAEIEEKLKTPLVKKLKEIMILRNSHPSFQGVFSLGETADHELQLRWKNDNHWSELYIDVENGEGRLQFSTEYGIEELIMNSK